MNIELDEFLADSVSLHLHVADLFLPFLFLFFQKWDDISGEVNLPMIKQRRILDRHLNMDSRVILTRSAWYLLIGRSLFILQLKKYQLSVDLRDLLTCVVLDILYLLLNNTDVLIFSTNLLLNFI